MERLAGMKLRDNLVKELGISEQVQASLDSGMDQSQNKMMSIPSSHCLYPMGINEYGCTSKIHNQTSQMTTLAGINMASPNLHFNYRVPQQQQHSYDQNCRYLGLLHKTISTQSVSGQHSSIKINIDTVTANSMRPTPAHCPSLPKQFSNLYRTNSTPKGHGLKSYGWKQQHERDPSPSWGTSYKQHNLPRSR